METTIALWLLAGGGFVLAAAAAVRARRLARQALKLSSDLDVVSQRLLRLEAEPVPAPAIPAVEPRPDDAASAAVQEVTAEIGVIGEIVRDLAVAVAAH